MGCEERETYACVRNSAPRVFRSVPMKAIVELWGREEGFCRFVRGAIVIEDTGEK